MPGILLTAFFGFLGGVARALVGTMKSLNHKKKFKLGYFLLTIIESAIIGIILGLVYSDDPKVAIAAGYAGTDLLESLYKLRN